jgi:hypothetical protein
MNKLQRNTIIILIIYISGVLIRIFTFHFDNDSNYIYITGSYLGNFLQIFSIIWAIINVTKILRIKDLMVPYKLFWLTLNLIPILFIFYDLLIN